VHVEVVTLFPALVRDALMHGVLGRAIANGLVVVGFEDPRAHASGVHRSVDDRPFGGGPGMVGSPAPWAAAIDSAARRAGPSPLRVHLSAQGRVFSQALARDTVAALGTGKRWSGLVLVASRYEGLDERVVESRTDTEWSVGDYVLSGGEFACLVVIDVLARLVPGVLGDESSASEESFSAARLDWPHYTRPPEWEGRRVPEVLLGGNHARIAQWRLEQSLRRTAARRPELLHVDSAARPQGSSPQDSAPHDSGPQDSK
jgi:tRNA (guanine37-N1)-methyltransferase